MHTISLLFKISWRNIVRHKGKSMVIGIILFLGAYIMTLGNAVISGMDRGLQANIRERFTGDIVLIATNQENNSVIFPPFGRTVETFGNYPDVRNFLSNQQNIKYFLPVLRGNLSVLNEEGDMGRTMALGLNIKKFQEMFESNVIFVEGRGYEEYEKGILISASNRSSIYRHQNFWILPEGGSVIEENLSKRAISNLGNLNPRSNLVIMGMSMDGAGDIRIPVKGIFRFSRLDNLWSMFNLMDIESFRTCFNYFTAEDSSIEIDEESQLLLESEDEMVFFFEESTDLNEEESIDLNTLFGEEDQNTSIQSLEAETEYDEEEGVFSFVLIKLNQPSKMNEMIFNLNRELSEKNLPVKAVSWKQAVGQIAEWATIIRAALFAFVLFLFFVAAIVIMNTLSMAAIERTNEIGMMRAVGAKKRFIGGMFFSETLALSTIFGGFGVFLGIITTFILNLFHIQAPNEYFQLLFGGDTFQPFLGTTDILLVLIQLAFVTIVACLYPINVAKNITPLEAIARE